MKLHTKFFDTVAGKILKYLLWLIIDLPCVWLFFWGCNLFVWLASLGFSFTDVLFSSLPSGPSLPKVIGFLCDGIWVYFFAYCALLTSIYKKDDGNTLPKSTYSIFTALLTLVVIILYDPRIGYHLPGFLGRGLHFLQNNWNFHLVGAFSWANWDFSGQVSDPFYFTCFDIGMILSYLFMLFCIRASDKK